MMKIKKRFDECPYKCNSNGTILDTATGKMVPCPYCSEKKRELMKEGAVEVEDDEISLPLARVLGIENEYLSDNFVYNAVVPEAELLFIDEESVQHQKEVAEELYLGLTIGNLPSESLCFGISIKGRAERFAYPMLAKAYMSGLTVCRFISCTEFNRISLDSKEDILEFYNADFLIMLINEGCLQADLASAKGLMQARSLKGKPTVFVTTWTVESCSLFLGFWDNDSNSLATPVFLEYKTSKKKGHSHYINKILGVENDFVESGNGNNTVSDFDMLADSGRVREQSSPKASMKLADFL